jgi:hypothetical protein
VRDAFNELLPRAILVLLPLKAVCAKAAISDEFLKGLIE